MPFQNSYKSIKTDGENSITSSFPSCIHLVLVEISVVSCYAFPLVILSSVSMVRADAFVFLV